MEALLSIERASEFLGISPWTTRKWARSRKLKTIRMGRRVLIEPDEVRRLIEEGRVQVTQDTTSTAKELRKAQEAHNVAKSD